jgi:hypothetical protein
MPSAETIILVQTLSVPIIYAELAFWFIRYQFDQNSKERKQCIKRDQANDKRAFELAGRSNEAINRLSTAVDLNTKAVEQMINQLSGLSGNLLQIKEKLLKDTA